jgi:hypothetical protein
VSRLRTLGAAASVAATIVSLAAVPASRAALPAAGAVPAFNHVFVIVLENENFADTWNPAKAPFLNSLVPSGAFADQYYGTGHVSADNYMAMTSGQPNLLPFNADCINYATCYLTEKAIVDPVHLQSGRNIADQLEDAGLNWRAYMQSMPGTCVHPALTDPADSHQTGYATRHNPFVYYPTIVDDQVRCDTHVVPYPANMITELSNAATAPNFAYIVPDTCDDGHDHPCADGRPGGLTSADLWLSNEVPKILASPAFADKGLLLITLDENGFTDLNGAVRPPLDYGGRIGLLALGAHVNAGSTTHGAYDHYSLLRTIEDTFGLTEHLNLAAIASPMSDLFTTTS